MLANLGKVNSSKYNEILITSELAGRPDRPMRLHAELEGFRELIPLLAADPNAAVQRFLQIALEQCAAGSAGLSLLRTDASGAQLFYWDALAGAYASFVGGTTPRNHSPCGLCLDAEGPILVSHPARLFAYFEAAQPPIVEGLVVPLYDHSGVALGTLWVVYHDDFSKCAPNDVRVLEHWASMLVLALQLLKDREGQANALTAAEARIDDSSRRHEQAAEALASERQKRERAEFAKRGLLETVQSKDVLYAEIHHRVKNSLQATISLLAMQERAPSANGREALREAQARLRLFAEVHELLYRNSSNTQDVPMGALLKSLAAALDRSFQRPNVRLCMHADEISLPPEQAVPAGLLMNEALTNAYKHAFPGDRAGQITVSFRAVDENELVLEVGDDGVGLSSDTREGGLGLTLIKAFAKQLSGTLSTGSVAGRGHRITVSMARRRGR